MSSGSEWLFRAFDPAIEGDVLTHGFRSYRLRNAPEGSTESSVLQPTELSYGTKDKGGSFRFITGETLEIAWQHPYSSDHATNADLRAKCGGGSPYISCSESLLWILFWVHKAAKWMWPIENCRTLKVAVIDSRVRGRPEVKNRPDEVLDQVGKFVIKGGSRPPGGYDTYRHCHHRCRELFGSGMEGGSAPPAAYLHNPLKQAQYARQSREVLIRGSIPASDVLAIFDMDEVLPTILDALCSDWKARNGTANCSRPTYPIFRGQVWGQNSSRRTLIDAVESAIRKGWAASPSPPPDLRQRLVENVRELSSDRQPNQAPTTEKIISIQQRVIPSTETEANDDGLGGLSAEMSGMTLMTASPEPPILAIPCRPCSLLVRSREASGGEAYGSNKPNGIARPVEV